MRFILLCSALFAFPVLAQVPDSVRGMEGALMKGDGVEAQKYIGHADISALEQAQRTYLTCVQARLDRQPSREPALPAFTGKVLLAYQNYWRKSLTAPSMRETHAAGLHRSLQNALGVRGVIDDDALEEKLQQKIASEGLHSLFGFTPPLRELMLWRLQTTKTFEVRLPEQTYASRVVMLDRFASSGWAAWATCDTRSTGGWATETEIHAVMPRYPGGVDSNEFLSVLLTHETQHFFDKNRFKSLQPWELEYRAKLAELWAANAQVAADRVKKFSDSRSEDPALAHPYANARLLAALETVLGKPVLDADNGGLHAAAAALLARDTAARLHSAN